MQIQIFCQLVITCLAVQPSKKVPKVLKRQKVFCTFADVACHSPDSPLLFTLGSARQATSRTSSRPFHLTEKHLRCGPLRTPNGTSHFIILPRPFSLNSRKPVMSL